jgi:Protein of unknown function (DUF1496)
MLATSLLATSAAAQSAPPAQASPVCLYESKSYTDGALICVYRTLMLSCSYDGGKASWKPVADRALASVCEGAAERPRVAEAPRPRHRHGVRRLERINAALSPKCFSFAGKRYCE